MVTKKCMYVIYVLNTLIDEPTGGFNNMSKRCEMKSAVLQNDLKKFGFDTSKGGFFNLCVSCQKKYGMVIRKTEKKCVFGCNN